MAEDINLASTVAVHISLILGVLVYMLVGAFVIQRLETVENSVMKNGDGANSKVLKRLYSGIKLSAIDSGIHRCLKKTIQKMMENTNCLDPKFEKSNITPIDECYKNAKFSTHSVDFLPLTEPGYGKDELSRKEGMLEDKIAAEAEKWSFGNSLLFTFSVITTIGYGHIAPETFYGRLFCIFFGLIGVPFTLLTVADLGMFLSNMLRKAANYSYDLSRRWCKCKWKKSKVLQQYSQSENGSEKDGMLSAVPSSKAQSEDEAQERVEDFDARKTAEALILGLTFVTYLVIGAKVLSVYEPEMDFFKAFYFNFVTLTTIGLGDFVPRSFNYLFITLCYIGVGLALTTMAIELAADLLRKLHYIGRRMDNISNTVVWFGGKKMTMKKLIKNLGDQFNIPAEELANFDLNQFVDNAIKVQAGEIRTLRKPVSPVVLRDLDALSYSKLRNSSGSDIRYVDERWNPPGDSLRTMETLQMNESKRRSMDVYIPHLDLDCPFFTDSSLPTSFDDELMKTLSTTGRGLDKSHHF